MVELKEEHETNKIISHLHVDDKTDDDDDDDATLCVATFLNFELCN